VRSRRSRGWGRTTGRRGWPQVWGSAGNYFNVGRWCKTLTVELVYKNLFKFWFWILKQIY
jgi:hypothetical protein